MGQPQSTDLTASAVRALGKILNAAADRHAAQIVTALGGRPSPPAAEPCSRLHGEPYTIDTPEGPRVGFVDDREQIRYVDPSRVAEVPARWSPLLLATRRADDR